MRLALQETDPKPKCAKDMATICKVNATTGRPNVHDQALLLEFTRLSHSQLWHANNTLPYFEQDLATFLLVRRETHTFILPATISVNRQTPATFLGNCTRKIDLREALCRV